MFRTNMIFSIKESIYTSAKKIARSFNDGNGGHLFAVNILETSLAMVTHLLSVLQPGKLKYFYRYNYINIPFGKLALFLINISKFIFTKKDY